MNGDGIYYCENSFLFLLGNLLSQNYDVRGPFHELWSFMLKTVGLAVSVKADVKDELVNASGCEGYELIGVFVNSEKYEGRT